MREQDGDYIAISIRSELKNVKISPKTTEEG